VDGASKMQSVHFKGPNSFPTQITIFFRSFYLENFCNRRKRYFYEMCGKIRPTKVLELHRRKGYPSISERGI
jgi:hypothetical protein